MVGPPARSATDSPEFLRVVGHAVRWRLITELGRSDRRVHELTTLVGAPQNLVSYHLAKLRESGLVTARRSSADGRDAYYRADLARVRGSLEATGTALHPGVQLTSPTPDPGRLRAAEARILFLCTGNSARSQIAEALVEARSGGTVAAHSAGSRPKALHPLAIRVMQDEYGIDIAAQRSKHLDTFADERFTHVITLCDRVREVCPQVPGHPEAVHWSMPDPAAAGSEGAAPSRAGTGYQAFVATAAELDERIGFLLAGLAPAGDTNPTPTRSRRRKVP